MLQPILVRPDGDGAYQLIAGERRWRAAQQAGLTVIPAIVREVRDVSALEHAVIENLHRQDLNALEEAAAYQQLIDDFGFTQQQLAQRVGKSRPSVANTLRLLNLPPAIQGLLIDGRLAAAHARALLGVEDRVEQQRLAEQAVAEGWSVRQVEQAVKDGGPRPAPRRPTAHRSRARPVPPPSSSWRSCWPSHLDTRVAVQTGAKRGKIVVEFADLDDLERLYRIIIAGD